MKAEGVDVLFAYPVKPLIEAAAKLDIRTVFVWQERIGLHMGAKLAHPDKLCINVWGDAAIGFTGMDFETAARERIPIRKLP